MNRFIKVYNYYSNIEFYQNNERISHWLESYDKNEAIFWVNIPLVKNEDLTDIKIRYGSGIEDRSNGNNTFLYFDDFSTNSDDKWSDEVLLYNRGGGDRFIWDTSNEQLITDESNSDWYSIYEDTIDDAILQNDGFVAEISTKTDDDDGMGICFKTDEDTDYELYASMTSNDYEGADNNNYESFVGWTSEQYNNMSERATEEIDYGQVIGG